MNKQYTIRSIPDPVDKVLKKTAQKTGRSFNSVVIEALERATGVNASKPSYNDLDALIGVGIQDEDNFNSSMEWLESLPSNLSTTKEVRL